MTVGELIEKLKQFDPSLQVVQSDLDAYHYRIYGDYDESPKLVTTPPEMRHTIEDPDIRYPAVEL